MQKEQLSLYEQKQYDRVVKLYSMLTEAGYAHDQAVKRIIYDLARYRSVISPVFVRAVLNK